MWLFNGGVKFGGGGDVCGGYGLKRLVMGFGVEKVGDGFWNGRGGGWRFRCVEDGRV